MDKVSISVIVPALNEEKYIARCLESVCSQLSRGDEIIVVDNGSSDKTTEIAKSMGVEVINERRKGQSFAVRKGFSSANNSILARLDADTMACDGWVDSIKDHYNNANEGSESLVALTGPVYLKEFLPLRLGVHQGIAKKKVGCEVLVGGNEALTRVLWDRLKDKMSYDDKSYAEDVEMSIRIERLGGLVEFVPGMKVLTSARWMIRHPCRSIRTWNIKMKNTVKLKS